MSGLVYLGLHYNKIEHLDFGVFSGLINLQHINLAGNELLKLHPDLIVGLTKTESLYLDGNFYLQIPTDRHFITSLSLKCLSITHCNIVSVSVETFANVTALETLDLSYTYLSSMDINILKSLPKLSAMPLYKCPSY
jgi:Leucine-rich repeat (LRR) protein